MRIFYFCVSLAVVFGCWMIGCEASNHRRLRNDLMQNYGSVHIRPVKETSTSTKVIVRPIFNNLINMDTRNQQFTIDTWIKMIWKDEFLTWNTSEFNGISKIYLPVDSVWKPDITFHENVDKLFQRHKPDTVIEIHSDGTVFWYLPAILISGCPIRVTWYPYDIQVCDMTFGSFGYAQVQFSPERSKDSVQTRYLENGVWDMVAVNMKQMKTIYTCCVEPFYEARYRLIFKRQPDFYLSFLIVPVFMLSLLSLLAFYLPPDCGEKLTLSITNLLALVVYQQFISENIPPTGHVSPVISKYFFSMIIMVSASVMATVCVIHIDAASFRPIPRWLRWLVLQKMPVFVCLAINDMQERQEFKIIHQSNGLQHPPGPEINEPSKNRLDELLHSAGRQLRESFKTQSISLDLNSKDLTQQSSSMVEVAGNSEPTSMQRGNNLDWKMVAVVIDRCLLFVFTTFAVVMMVTVSVIIITGSKSEYENEMNLLFNEWANDTVRILR